MEKLDAKGRAQVNKVLTVCQKNVVKECLREIMDASDESGVEHTTFEELVSDVTRRCPAKGGHFTEEMVSSMLQEIIEAL